MDSCENCRFFSDNGMYPRGECRRHAPVSHRPPNASWPNPQWPILLMNEWCGDHESKEPK